MLMLISVIVSHVPRVAFAALLGCVRLVASRRAGTTDTYRLTSPTDIDYST